MPGTDYFGETALKQDITYLSTPAGNHTVTHFSRAALVQAYIAT